MAKAKIDAMMQKLNYWNPDQSDLFIDRNIGMGAMTLYNSVFSEKEQQPFVSQNTIVIADARIDNRKELSALLTCNEDIPDSQLIATAYNVWKEDCPKYLVGDYAFAIWDRNEEKLFCARDHAGFRPFFFYSDDEKFVFSSEIKGIKALTEISLSVDYGWIADSIATIAQAKERTMYNEVFRLKPAHSICVGKTNSSITKYWDLDFSTKTKLNCENDYINKFREILDEAVACRLKTNYPVASELSGGIDSSGVSSIAFNKINKDNSRFYALSHVLPDNLLGKVHPFSDEREFSNLVCQYAGIENHLYVTSEDKTIIKEMKAAIDLQDGIMGQNLYLFSDNLYEMAAEKGCRTLLSGFGGDEFVSNSCSGYLESLVHKFKFRKAYKKIPSKNKIPLYRLFRLKLFMFENYLPFVYKLFRNRNKWVKERYRELLFDKEFGKKMNIRKRYSVMKGFPTDKSMEMRQYKRFNLPHVSLRHETCYIAARNYKLEYTYPLWDRRLMEFFFSIPSEIKFGNGKGRYIYRKALEGYVPKKVQYRADKTGTTISTVDLRILNDKENIIKLIEDLEKTDLETFVDYKRMKEIFAKIIEKAKNPKAAKVNKGVFLKALKVLVYQKYSKSDF
ncbi:MAG: hypothetical protein JXR58_09895 [Bacteroidales bacterium]|nr:hypothetical protein [Bacteroidales bacterium]